MTKVAIKGPATGTGTYTLRAPDTASTLDFELPTVGTHLASAQADGMPLGTGGDPVVESGSNTDGEWTRWADGTQHCAVLKSDQETGNIFTRSTQGLSIYQHNTSWAFPVSFSQAPKVFGNTDQNTSGALVTTRPRTITTASVTVGSYSLDSWASYSRRELYILATGRWK